MRDSARTGSTDRGTWLAPVAFVLLTAVLLGTLAAVGYLYYSAGAARSHAYQADMAKRWAESERDILGQELADTRNQLTAARIQLAQAQERIRNLAEEQPGQQSRPQAVATAQLAREVARVATALDQCLAAHQQFTQHTERVLSQDMLRLLRQLGDACRQARQGAEQLQRAVPQPSVSPTTLPVHEGDIPSR
ncbi:hypothetical protein C3Y87_10865 [Carbonactinospora thermoautotrophica]|uniref:Uncharacterized protein n=1 Tax=Carbonactinospora thermoautotrophica TaxID=1469144 RepID=A0A132N1W5_9ACTN|nr:hypothetical protein [Carbonactinospora thermoautotrophica]KWW99511.1 hypothetical protein LI90_1147 [Carbonactinospora thermoautotrophica]KWX04084.1 hypothetical protein TH66_09110 [Carbonactinospora thermoautotrophica]KWX06837.1 hypothetical protein TR74_20800 [Carbonactinospora thermoautotrophica]MCX9191908.1 hypothetical protein [Carbonactinospora thermoautotrophica]